MKNKMRIWQLALTMFLLLQHLAFVPLSEAGEILIIAHKGVSAGELSKNEIKSIFLGEKIRWDDDRKMTFVILKTKEHDEFLRAYIGNTAAQYLNYWKKMVFTGKSKSPKAFDTPEKLLEYVAETDGSVGYIPSEAYSEAYNDKVKIISVK
ncbi:MAG: hypothetical protein BWK80_31910 [Desulfobacteraceae bacterium IS3]|nr:MAG: hypothetical protein BWK80_31910 [Desulfobacteraceae bacterium IS3]